MYGFAAERLAIDRARFDARSGVVGLAVLSLFAMAAAVRVVFLQRILHGDAASLPSSA